ncbi:DeoR/GlpR transcriptional regulator [Fertoebacter nigrum]|uniref:DeoR/GlpR transcriptional regulator n=1 Tax=Fertoeibacter niger TaxID=2656921 RepID=A0A8X8KQS6_9RHOB|nr:DeoR/GlpR family DNA-binding transcription regulator [Fertoeibacter niger]NUB44407.1 DeoR/GlpR transcriptional regulator [Fertoeibacter niger]
MLTAQRKALLLDRLHAEGRLVARGLAEELGTSEDTIRRDLRELAAEGLLTRVHGGALPASPTHRPMRERSNMEVSAKQRLGVAGAALIRPGQTVILDGGTTHLALVQALPATLAATIITHSPTIAAALEPFARLEVIVIGGRLMRHSMVALGAATQAGFAAIRADMCILGVTGLHPEAGLTTGDHEEALIKRRMVQSAGETIVLATPDKIGAASAFQIAGLEEARIITTGEPPDWLPRAQHLRA